MNENALQSFVKIVELESFSEAAEALFVSQSALSQQIRALEKQLKVELFRHTRRQVILTPAGRSFIRRPNRYWPFTRRLSAVRRRCSSIQILRSGIS